LIVLVACNTDNHIQKKVLKMKCLKCQFDNSEGAKFCNECGNKLEMGCPECGKLNQPGSRFCNECGHNISFPSDRPPIDLSFDDKLAKIQRYLPEGLAEKILSQKDKIEGERKQLTVMFCDLVQYTSLSEKLDPEETYQLMDAIYELLIHEVHAFQGTVNEMTGDGILALFGAPITLEDAPQGILTVFHLAHAGLAALYAGKSDFALDFLQRGELVGEKVGHPYGLAYLRVALAEALLRLDRVDESIKPAEAALHFSQKLDLGATLQWALEINAEILANMVPPDETRIDKVMKKAAALVKRSGSPWYRIRHLLARARVALKLTQLEVVRESLAAARLLYQEIGIYDGTAELHSVEKALEELGSKGGNYVRGK
jgi:class 3 adenylate cyclase